MWIKLIMHTKSDKVSAFSVELDDDELLYDQLWKDSFEKYQHRGKSKYQTTCEYVPKRYWRYMNEKTI